MTNRLRSAFSTTRRTACSTLVAAVAALAITLTAALPAGGQEIEGSSESTTFTFEDYPANISGSGAAPPITTEYADDGLIFPNGVTALLFNDSSFPPRPDLPHSGETIITTCYSAEFCSSRIVMEFTEALEVLELYAGYSSPLDTAADLVLEAYDTNGAVVGVDIVTLGPSDRAVAADTVLRVEDSAGRIQTARVLWADESRFLSQLLVDDITVSPFVAATELTPDVDTLDLNVDAVGDGEAQIVTVTNTGNVPIVGVIPRLASDNEVVAVLAATTDQGCGSQLDVGQSCVVSVSAVASPDAQTSTSFETELTLLDNAGQLLATVQVNVSVSVPEQVTTTSTTATTVTDEPEDIADEDPAPEDDLGESAQTPEAEEPVAADEVAPEESIDPLLGLLLPVLMVGALALILRFLLRRRGSRSHALAPPTPPPPPPPPPEQFNRPPPPSVNFTVRPDSGKQTINEKPGSVLTLVASLTTHPADTTIEERARQ